MGIMELDKAFDLARGNHSNYMVEEIWQVLSKAKYMKWELKSNKRLWKLQKLNEACEEAITEHMLEGASEAEGAPEYAMKTCKEHLELLYQVFRKAEAADKPAEVPDHLCCKITLDILRDPVITPGGITYERAAILDHFCMVGQFDPVTREPLEECQLVSNLPIKEAVSVFLDEHGWAYKTMETPSVNID